MALAFFPSFIYCASLKDSYSDIKNTGLHAFLTEPFKPVTNMKRLPSDLILKLEQSSLNDPKGRLNEFIEWRHFENFKMNLAGQSDKYFFICYQTGKSMPFCHLVVFLKAEKKNNICFKKQIPSPEYCEYSLKGIRELVAGYFRKEEKRNKATAQWIGAPKGGWVNLITGMHLKISEDGKSIISTDRFKGILWATDVRSLWADQDEQFYPEKFFPRGVAKVGFDEGLIYVYWAKCWGQIDVKTGVFTFDGCD